MSATRPTIISHRGLCRTSPDAPRAGENTLEAFREGLAALATLDMPPAIEFDVRRSRDGLPVVIHDATVDRTTNGTGLVSEHSAAELRQLDAGFGRRIPLLTEVLDLFADGDLCIELKEPGLGRDVKELLLARGLADRALVSSFLWLELPPLRPEIRIALTASAIAIGGGDNFIRAAIEHGAVEIHPEHTAATAALVAAARRARLRVSAWTVNRPADYERTAAAGVDRVFCDNPAFIGRRS